MIRSRTSRPLSVRARRLTRRSASSSRRETTPWRASASTARPVAAGERPTCLASSEGGSSPSAPSSTCSSLSCVIVRSSSSTTRKTSLWADFIVVARKAMSSLASCSALTAVVCIGANSNAGANIAQAVVVALTTRPRGLDFPGRGRTLRDMGRRELFPVDRGLQARMVLAAVLTPTVVVAALAACAWFLPLKVVAGIVVAAVIGIGSAAAERTRAREDRVLRPGEEPEVQPAVHRLCLVADLPRPEVVVAEERHPNSWVVDAPGRVPRLHVTRGLLELLDPAELEAVLAHELSHIAHRDATVMTVVGMPGAVLAGGGSRLGGFWPLMAGRMIPPGLGRVAGVGTAAGAGHRRRGRGGQGAALAPRGAGRRRRRRQAHRPAQRAGLGVAEGL